MDIPEYLRSKKPGLGGVQPKARSTRRSIVATYEYTDAAGALLYQVVRYDPKDFKQRKPDGKGGWIYKKVFDGVTRVPYRLTHLLANPDAPVFVTEGEKDADRVASLDLNPCATTAASHKWTADIANMLKGRDLYIFSDNDDVGRKAALDAAYAVNGKAKTIRIVALPGLPENGDVSDWLDADPARNSADLVVECLRAPIWDNAGASQNDEDINGTPEIGVNLDDFRAFMPSHTYIFVPTREMWPASSVNSRVPPVKLLRKDGTPVKDKNGNGKRIKANIWLDAHRPVEQMTWAPGLPLTIADLLISEGGWIERNGVTTFNLYRPPIINHGNSASADCWIELVHRIYPDDADHIITFCAHRVQHPEVKINHGLILGGAPGIGKDSLLEPLKYGVGPWNFKEVSPQDIMSNYNDYMRCVVLRVSEAHDLGDVNRYAFYDHMKTMLATPPDVMRINGKYIPQHYVLNVAGVIYTTNHRFDGVYLPADDRRTYVAWSEIKQADFTNGFWPNLWGWYKSGGLEDIVAYLTEHDISRFDPKAPPKKTDAFWQIVGAGAAPEDSDLADILDRLGVKEGAVDADGKTCSPTVTTLAKVVAEASGDFYEWLSERKNRRVVPHRFERCGYTPVRNDDAKDGLWVIGGKRQVVYGRSDLLLSDRVKAAKAILK
jgi:hypothetical protein